MYSLLAARAVQRAGHLGRAGAVLGGAVLGGAVRCGHELVALVQDEGLRRRAQPGAQAGRYRLPGVTSSEISRVGRVRLPTARIIRHGRKVKVPGIGRLKLMTQVRTPTGVYSLAPLPALDNSAAAGVYIVYTSEDNPVGADTRKNPATPRTLDEPRAITRRVLGGELPMTSPQLLSRLIGNSRQAERYRAGRILLAGDAAHREITMIIARCVTKPAPAAALLIRPDGYVAWALARATRSVIFRIKPLSVTLYTLCGVYPGRGPAESVRSNG